MAQLIVIVAMFALLWLLFIRPQRRRASPAAAVSGFELGDEILTAGGIYGRRARFGTTTSWWSRSRRRRESAWPRRAVAASSRPTSRTTSRRRSREPERPSRTKRSAANLPSALNRRPHLILVALIVAALIGVGLIAIPGSPLHQAPTLGLDLQGGLEVTLEGGDAEEPAAADSRPRPLGRDPPEPGRQARRRRARDPQAGLEPDRDRPRRASRTRRR